MGANTGSVFHSRSRTVFPGEPGTEMKPRPRSRRRAVDYILRFDSRLVRAQHLPRTSPSGALVVAARGDDRIAVCGSDSAADGGRMHLPASGLSSCCRVPTHAIISRANLVFIVTFCSVAAWLHGGRQLTGGTLIVDLPTRPARASLPTGRCEASPRGAQRTSGKGPNGAESLSRKWSRIQDRHWWFVARRRILETVIRSLDIPQPRSILEVGCGMGGNLPDAERAGQVTGIEADDPARDWVAKHLGITVHPGHLSDGLRLPAGERFGLICLPRRAGTYRG